MSGLGLVWVGFHMEGLPALRAVLGEGYDVRGVVTLTPQAAARHSGAVDYSALCEEFGVPLFRIGNINDSENVELLRQLDPDVLLVIGWSQLLGDDALDVPRIGVMGAHASLLPNNRGRAPVNWAIIRGEELSGNTLMWLNADVDAGEIIDQEAFRVRPQDTCATVYEKVAQTNKSMILSALAQLTEGELESKSQPEASGPVLPGRKPQDGEVDWAATGWEVYNLVRAVTEPYPGAYSFLDGERWTIWRCAFVPGQASLGEPGMIIGPVWTSDPSSPAPGCGSTTASSGCPIPSGDPGTSGPPCGPPGTGPSPLGHLVATAVHPTRS